MAKGEAAFALNIATNKNPKHEKSAEGLAFSAFIQISVQLRLGRTAGSGAAFALDALAGQLAGAAHGFSLLASALFGRLFVMHVALHFTERAFTLHLLLEGLQGLVDVVVTDENLYQRSLSIRSCWRPLRGQGPRRSRSSPPWDVKKVEPANGVCGTVALPIHHDHAHVQPKAARKGNSGNVFLRSDTTRCDNLLAHALLAAGRGTPILINMSEAEPFSDLKSAEVALAQAVAGFIPELGLNRMSFHAGARAAGLSVGERDLIAPNGALDIAAILWRGHDAALTTPEVTAALPGMKIREKINHLLNLRIDAFAREEKLAHRLTGFLMLPMHLDLHRRLMWDTADLIWRLAGDKALDENHYSKRTIVCGILAAAMLTRLSRGAEAQSEQISRNIDAVMEYEKFKAKMPFKPEAAFLQLAADLGKLRYGRSDAAAEAGQ